MISIVIPVYNEEKNISQSSIAASHMPRKWGEEYEVVIVDDGSSDSSPPQLEIIHRQDPRWKVLAYFAQFRASGGGVGRSLLLLGRCRGHYGCRICRTPLRNCGRFLDKWRQGYHVGYAIRIKRKEGLLKRAGATTFFIAYCAGWPPSTFR